MLLPISWIHDPVAARTIADISTLHLAMTWLLARCLSIAQIKVDLWHCDLLLASRMCFSGTYLHYADGVIRSCRCDLGLLSQHLVHLISSHAVDI